MPLEITSRDRRNSLSKCEAGGRGYSSIFVLAVKLFFAATIPRFRVSSQSPTYNASKE